MEAAWFDSEEAAEAHFVQQLGAPDGDEIGAALRRRRLRQQRLPAACDVAAGTLNNISNVALRH